MNPNKIATDTLIFMEMTAPLNPDSTAIGLTMDGRLVSCPPGSEIDSERLTQKLKDAGINYDHKAGLNRNISIIRDSLNHQSLLPSRQALPDGFETAVATLCNHIATFVRDDSSSNSPQVLMDALRRLQLSHETLNVLQSFFVRLSHQPNSQSNSHYQNYIFFQRVNQLLSYFINMANHETATQLIHIAATQLESDCHDQTASILDRMLQSTAFFSLKTLLTPDSNNQINWFNFLSSIYKQFHDRAFDQALEQTYYEAKAGLLGTQQQLLITHPEFIAVKAMLKNLFSLDKARQTGVCNFVDDRCALSRPRWEGSLSSFQKVLDDIYEVFHPTITDDDKFIEFFEELFQEPDGEEESLWTLTVRSHPVLHQKISEITTNAQELSCCTAENDTEQLGLMDDLTSNRTLAIQSTKREFITSLLNNFREQLFTESPVIELARHRLRFTCETKRFRPHLAPCYTTNVVNVWQE